MKQEPVPSFLARYNLQMGIEPELMYDNGVFYEPCFEGRHRYVAL